MSCDCVAVLGDGVVSVSDGALELLARLSDLRHRLHPLVVVAQGARLHGEQRHLWVTQEEDMCERHALSGGQSLSVCVRACV